MLGVSRFHSYRYVYFLYTHHNINLILLVQLGIRQRSHHPWYQPSLVVLLVISLLSLPVFPVLTPKPCSIHISLSASTSTRLLLPALLIPSRLSLQQFIYCPQAISPLAVSNEASHVSLHVLAAICCARAIFPSNMLRQRRVRYLEPMGTLPRAGLYLMDSSAHYAPAWRISMQAVIHYFFTLDVGVYVAVMDGARLLEGDYLYMLDGLVARVPAFPIFAVVVSMGNDLLRGGYVPVRVRLDHDHHLRIARSILELRRQLRIPCMGLVYGGSSALWGYQGREAVDYDAAVGGVMSFDYSSYQYVARGPSFRLRVYDHIGHIVEAEVPRVIRYLINAGRLTASMSPRL